MAFCSWPICHFNFSCPKYKFQSYREAGWPPFAGNGELQHQHFPFQVHLGIGLTSSIMYFFLSCFYLWYQRKTKSKLILFFFFFLLLLVTYNYVRFYIPFSPVDSSKCYLWAFNISWETSRFVATLIHVMVQHHQVLKEAAVRVLTHQRGLTETDLCPWCFI